MARRVVVLALVVASCHGAGSRWRPGPGDELTRPDRNFQMSRPEVELTAAGGFRIIASNDISSRRVELGLRVPSGNIHDPPGKEGLAHLVEHLVFELRPAGPSTPSLGARLRAIASDVNATTDVEATHYVAAASLDQAPAVAALLAEIPIHARCEHLDRRVFAREREVVRNELHLRGDASSRALLDALTSAAYPPGHPYARASHTSASLDAITWDDVCGFLEAHYRPSDMFLVVSGGLLRSQLAPVIAPFDPIAAGEPAAPSIVPQLFPVQSRTQISADLVDDAVLVVWPLPGRYSTDGVAGRTIAAWLGGALRRAERDGRIGENQVLLMGGPRAPYIAVAVKRGKDRPDRIRDAIVEVARHLWDDIDADNAFVVKQAAGRAILEALIGERGRSTVLADYTQFDADGSLASDVARIEALDRDQLAELTARLFTASRASIIEVTAAGDGGRDGFPRGAIGEPPEALTAPEASGADAYQARVELTSFTLDNGLIVVLAPSYFTPMIRADLVIPGGAAHHHDNPAVPWFAAFALDPPRDGPGSYGSAGLLLQSALADYGVEVDAFATHFEVSALSGWQDVVVWGLARLVGAGTYDREDLGRLIRRRRDAMARSRDPRVARLRRAVRAWDEARFGARHPAVRRVKVSDQDLAALDLGALSEWHRAHHRPDGAVLVVTGNFSTTLLTKHIKAAFSSWSRGTSPLNPPPPAAPVARRIALVDAAETHVSVQLALAVDLATPRDEAAARLAAELLEERLAAVRERLGAAYALHASLRAPSLAPAIGVSGQVDGAFAREAFTLVAAALGELRAGRFTDDELERARRRAARELRIRLAGTDDIRADVLDWTRAGRGLRHGAAVVDALDGLTGAAGRDAVAPALAAMPQVMLSGPRAEIEAASAALGGPPDVLVE